MWWSYFTIHIIFVTLTRNSRSDWVEIPQFSNRRTYYTFGPPRYSLQKPIETSSEHYEMVMKTPYISTTMQTTTEIEVEDDDDNNNKNEKEIEYEEVDRKGSEVDIVDVEEEQQKEIPAAEVTTPNPNEITNEENTSYPGFLPLLKSIQQNLVAKVKKSLRSKMDLLKNLRDTLLLNIDERMTNLWKYSANNLPEARGHSDSEMDFPSNEGALMTIGFLTFAVFLIKLIIKLIHALKNKQYNTTITATTAGGATTYYGRRKRDADYYNSNKILQYIEEYEIN